jgi:uroporphyrinogen decarboxylase
VSKPPIASTATPAARTGVDSLLVRTARGEVTERVPVWFMRQAGRALPEYRAIRGSGSILQVTRDPDLVAEITLQPVRRYGVDAAVLFSDIMVPLAFGGFPVEIIPGRGPVVDAPISGLSDLNRLSPTPDLSAVETAVQILVSQLEVPLIGFAGGPFTVASYLVEGGPSRTFARTKTLMRQDPELWEKLCTRLADIAVTFLKAQVAAGASAVQLFDSWAGSLSPRDYLRYARPYSRVVLGAARALGVPTIHFGVGTGELLAMMAGPEVDVVGVDWRVPLTEARARLGPQTAIQGNLDPAACLAPWPVVETSVKEVMADGGDRPGWIFNLGHGVLPETDPGILTEVVDLVKTVGRRS